MAMATPPMKPSMPVTSPATLIPCPFFVWGSLCTSLMPYQNHNHARPFQPHRGQPPLGQEALDAEVPFSLLARAPFFKDVKRRSPLMRYPLKDAVQRPRHQGTLVTATKVGLPNDAQEVQNHRQATRMRRGHPPEPARVEQAKRRSPAGVILIIGPTDRRGSFS